MGYECEDMARDIKFNLKQQSDKLENSTLQNLFSIQKQTLMSNSFLDQIHRNRLYNRLVLAGIMTAIVLSCIFILYIT